MVDNPLGMLIKLAVGAAIVNDSWQIILEHQGRSCYNVIKDGKDFERTVCAAVL